MLRRMMMAAGSLPPVSYVGGSFSYDQSGSSIYVPYPAGTLPGDEAIAILRCRGDRSFASTPDWSVAMSQSVPSTVPQSPNTTIAYVFKRTVGSESGGTFTQSASAAHSSSMIVFRGGSAGPVVYADGNVASVNKSTLRSTILCVALSNASPNSGPSSVSGYSPRGASYFLTGGVYYFASSAYTRELAPSGVNSVVATYPQFSETDAMILIEVG